MSDIRAPGTEYDRKICLGIFIFGGIAENGSSSSRIGRRLVGAVAAAAGVDCVKSKTIIDIISVCGS